MVYDSKRGVTVLYGGYPWDQSTISSHFAYDDTWEFDGLTWNQVLPATKPFPLAHFAMSYDSGTGLTIMNGGSVGSNGWPRSGFTWEYDGVTWQVASINGNSPGPRSGCQMAYDRARGVHVLFGGIGNQAYGERIIANNGSAYLH